MVWYKLWYLTGFNTEVILRYDKKQRQLKIVPKVALGLQSEYFTKVEEFK